MSGNIKFKWFLLAPIVLALLVLVTSTVSWAGELEDAQEAVRQNPDDAKAHVNLGYAYDKSGQYQEAIASYKESIRIKPDHADAQYYLGYMYEEGRGVPQDYKEAVKWYRLAAEQGDIDAKKKLKELGVSKAIEKMLEKIKRKMAENEFTEFKNIKKGGMNCTYHSPYTGEMKYQWYVNDDAKGFKVFMNGVLLNDTQGIKQKNGLKILYKKFIGPGNQVRMHEIGIDMSFFDGGKFYLDFVKTQSIHSSIGYSYQGDCQKP